MYNFKGLCISHLVLACSVAICAVFAIWLNSDTEVEEYRAFMLVYDNFFFTNEKEEAKKFRHKKLAELKGNKIDNMWLPIVEVEEDGPYKIQLYIRILAGDPEKEFTYIQLAALIYIVFPEESQRQQRNKFFKEIQEIEGIHYHLLEKYNLLVSQ
ncbi:MAG: hypothetical protein HND53_06460 [Proteobacteria bacterium]|nr:hypothetical protein [Pseudomonadota bacterium]NOG60125.1 hypothetical protein [Pseudomonadota bacterium]